MLYLEIIMTVFGTYIVGSLFVLARYHWKLSKERALLSTKFEEKSRLEGR